MTGEEAIVIHTLYGIKKQESAEHAEACALQLGLLRISARSKTVRRFLDDYFAGKIQIVHHESQGWWVVGASNAFWAKAKNNCWLDRGPKDFLLSRSHAWRVIITRLHWLEERCRTRGEKRKKKTEGGSK